MSFSQKSLLIIFVLKFIIQEKTRSQRNVFANGIKSIKYTWQYQSWLLFGKLRNDESVYFWIFNFESSSSKFHWSLNIKLRNLLTHAWYSSIKCNYFPTYLPACLKAFNFVFKFPLYINISDYRHIVMIIYTFV